MMESITTRALRALKTCRDRLTLQQYKTLRGQIIAGDPEGALRGLDRILTGAKKAKSSEES